MAYTTIYHLHISEPAPSIADIACLLAGISDQAPIGHPRHQGSSQTWQEVLTGQQRSSWYSHEQHMRTISAAYPNVLFTLGGRGEEAHDQWVAYHRNGKMQREERGTWTHPPFDPGKLA